MVHFPPGSVEHIQNDKWTLSLWICSTDRAASYIYIYTYILLLLLLLLLLLSSSLSWMMVRVFATYSFDTFPNPNPSPNRNKREGKERGWGHLTPLQPHPQYCVIHYVLFTMYYSLYPISLCTIWYILWMRMKFSSFNCMVLF